MAYRRTYQLYRQLKAKENKALAKALFDTLKKDASSYNQFLEVISSIQFNTDKLLPFPATHTELIERDFEAVLTKYPKHALSLIFAVASGYLFEGNAVEICPNLGYVMCRYSDLDEEVADMENCIEKVMSFVANTDKSIPYHRFVYLLRITIGG